MEREGARAPLYLQHIVLPRKVKNRYCVVEIYRKSFSPCVRKSFYINTTRHPLNFRRGCGTVSQEKGSQQYNDICWGETRKSFSLDLCKNKYTLPRGKDDTFLCFALGIENGMYYSPSDSPTLRNAQKSRKNLSRVSIKVLFFIFF